ALDIAYLLPVPGMTITAPKDGTEMIGLLKSAVDWTEGPFSIRWPRDVVPAPVPPVAEILPVEYGTWEILREGHDIAILATGTMVLPALEAAKRLEREGIDATVVNCRFVKPLDEACLRRLFPAHGAVLTVEEGTVVNGFGAFARARIADAWPQVRGASMGMPDAFVTHGERAELLAEIGLTAEGIAERVLETFGAAIPHSYRASA
ncbi:MAG TPA: transketolase C-terminal domain-containing protein, partial [Longimicrobiaceae bacterium]|nr:transketolase C-terminal domain-containing protein [Longimicrobiaceae bacterium]